MAKRLTKNQQAYLHELSLLERRVKAFEKKYNISSGINISYTLPKRVTKKDILGLKSIKRKQIAEIAGRNNNFNPQTGEVYEDEPVYDDNDNPVYQTMINNYLETNVQGWNEAFEQHMTNWLNQQIETKGKKRVATMLQSAVDDGHIITNHEAYSYLVNMLNYLPDISDKEREVMISYLDYDLEQYED